MLSEPPPRPVLALLPLLPLLAVLPLPRLMTITQRQFERHRAHTTALCDWPARVPLTAAPVARGRRRVEMLLPSLALLALLAGRAGVRGVAARSWECMAPMCA